MVKLLPDGIVNTGTAHSDDVLHQYEHNVTKDAAHRWADFVPASQLDVAIEYVEET